MTAADVTTELHIPWAHRWNSTHFRHADSSNDNSTDQLDIVIQRTEGKNQPAQFAEDLLRIDNFTGVIRTDLWGEMFEREASVYDIILNSTSTDRIYPVFYVQKLGEI